MSVGCEALGMVVLRIVSLTLGANIDVIEKAIRGSCKLCVRFNHIATLKLVDQRPPVDLINKDVVALRPPDDVVIS